MIYMAVFLLLTCGFVDLFKINLAEVVEPPDKKKVHLETVSESTDKKSKKFTMARHHREMEATLQALGEKVTWEKYLRITAICGCIGASIGAACNNFMLAIVLATGFFIAPSFYFQFRRRAYEKLLHDQMQNGVAIMTNTYTMYHDVSFAFTEALKTADEPFKSRLVYFLTRINTNVSAKDALRELRPMVDDHYWREWIDLMIQCQTNSSLNEMLLPIPETMSKQSQMQAQWDTQSQRIWLEHFAFAGLSIGSIFLIMLLNRDWGNVLLNTTIGHFVVALNVLVVILSSLYAYKVNKPIYAEV